MPVGGSIESVTLNGRGFAVAADSDVARDLGGYSNENQMNGDGTARLVKTVIGWRLEGLALSIDDARGDDEFLTDLKNSPDYFTITITYASGIVYQGSGQIVDESTTSSQSTTKEISLAGPGVLSKQ
jgi:hypothetical protein